LDLRDEKADLRRHGAAYLCVQRKAVIAEVVVPAFAENVRLGQHP
jgi:hypothetical protein